MIDLRYLGLTLIAVFLALAVGLMTGSALGSPERQAAVYEGLRNQFEELRTQNQQVREESDTVRRGLAARDRAMRDLMPLVIRDRLSGVRVGVILCGALDERPFWGDLENALTLAGAHIGPIIRIPDQPQNLTSADRQRFEGYWRPATAPPAEAHPLEVATWSVQALIRPGQEQRLRELARTTGIELRGDLTSPVRRILILTGMPEASRAVAVSAGEVPEKWVVDTAVNEPGLRAVLCEPEGLSISAVEPLRSRNLPTVDHIDTPAGQISAVLALAGAEGHFGSQPGATRPLPPVAP